MDVADGKTKKKWRGVGLEPWFFRDQEATSLPIATALLEHNFFKSGTNIFIDMYTVLIWRKNDGETGLPTWVPVAKATLQPGHQPPVFTKKNGPSMRDFEPKTEHSSPRRRQK